MAKTNRDRLVRQSVQGKVHHPLGNDYRVERDGEPRILPATGGICYNVKVGDPAFGWEGDHIEPGVSVRNEEVRENQAFTALSCIGNEAIVVSGDAKGERGYVTGKHGGIDHVLVYFDDETLNALAIDDKIMVRAHGQGLKLLEYPEIKLMNIDPDLFDRIQIEEKEGRLIVPVAAEVPAVMMASGLGARHAYSGDFDIMTGDKAGIEASGIDQLRFGDLVLLKDMDCAYGYDYRPGAVSIGVIVHSDCIKMGHGPGVTVILTSRDGKIDGLISEGANIKDLIENA
jgi:hypothetical protein